MVFKKHGSLKSDIFFNAIFIPRLSRSMLFGVQVFQSPGLGFRMSQGFSGSGSSVLVQGSGTGFRGSPNIYKN